MTEGSAQDDDDGKEGPGAVPGYQPMQPGAVQQGSARPGQGAATPTWPSQPSNQPSQSQIDTQDRLPSQNAHSASGDEGGPSAKQALNQGYPQLQLPSKPKANKPNLALNRIPGQDQPDPGYPDQPRVAGGPVGVGLPGGAAPVWPGSAHANAGSAHANAGSAHANAVSAHVNPVWPGHAAHGHEQMPGHGPQGFIQGQGHGAPQQANYGAPQQPNLAAQQDPNYPTPQLKDYGGQHEPGGTGQNRQPDPPQNYARISQPGQVNPDFVPPTQAPALPNAGYVPTNPALPQPLGAPPHKAQVKPGAPIITSASAKPNWTQPQWPGNNPMSSPKRSGFGPVLARRTTGSRLPPAISPVPEAPYSNAPPTLGGIASGDLSTNQNPAIKDLNFSSLGQAHQGLKNTLHLTIQRDLMLSKQLFGDQANKPAAKERREYKQTEYIPKAPKLKVAAADPDRPWNVVPAATYEFFADDDKGPHVSQPHAALPQQREPQVPRAFNPANPRVVEDDAPDPRYSPFQGEVLKDIAIQDKKAGYAEDPIPEETRARGAAALRALNRTSDHYYENHPGTSPQPENMPAAVRLSSRDLFGLATYYFIVTKEVLTSPHAFFASMSLAGGLNDPLLYLAFTSVMAGVFVAIAKLNPLLFFLTVIFSFCSVAIGAVVMQLIFKKLGGEGKFEQTFNVLAYSKATFIFAWISLGPWPVGMIVASLFTAYLNYLGMSRVHRLPPATTWTIIGVMTAVPLLTKFIFK